MTTPERSIFNRAIELRRVGDWAGLSGLRAQVPAQEEVIFRDLTRRVFKSHQAADLGQLRLSLQAAVDLGLEEGRENDSFLAPRQVLIRLRQKYLPEPAPAVSLRDEYVREERERLEGLMSTGTPKTENIFRVAAETAHKEDIDRVSPEKRANFINEETEIRQKRFAAMLFEARVTPQDSLWGSVSDFFTAEDFAIVQRLFFELIQRNIAPVVLPLAFIDDARGLVQFPEDQAWLEQWRDYFASQEAQARPLPEASRESVFAQLRTLYQQNAGYNEIEKAEIELAGTFTPEEQDQIEEIGKREAQREETRRIPYLAQQLYASGSGSWLDQNEVSKRRELLQQLFPAGDFTVRDAAYFYWEALTAYEQQQPGSGQRVSETLNTLRAAIDHEAGVTEDEFYMYETANKLGRKRENFMLQLTAKIMPEDEELRRLFTDMEAVRVAARQARETVFKKRGDYFDELAERAGIKKATWEGGRYGKYQIEYEEETRLSVADTPPVPEPPSGPQPASITNKDLDASDRWVREKRGVGNTAPAEPLLLLEIRPAAAEGGVPPVVEEPTGGGLEPVAGADQLQAATQEIEALKIQLAQQERETYYQLRRANFYTRDASEWQSRALRMAAEVKLLQSLLAQSRAQGSERSAAQEPRRQTKTPFEVLGVPETASQEEIIAAYRELQRAHHPDAVGAILEQAGIDISSNRGKGFIKIANERAAEINVAYETLRAQRGV